MWAQLHAHSAAPASAPPFCPWRGYPDAARASQRPSPRAAGLESREPVGGDGGRQLLPQPRARTRAACPVPRARRRRTRRGGTHPAAQRRQRRCSSHRARGAARSRDARRLAHARSSSSWPRDRATCVIRRAGRTRPESLLCQRSALRGRARIAARHGRPGCSFAVYRCMRRASRRCCQNASLHRCAASCSSAMARAA